MKTVDDIARRLSAELNVPLHPGDPYAWYWHRSYDQSDDQFVQELRQKTRDLVKLVQQLTSSVEPNGTA